MEGHIETAVLFGEERVMGQQPVVSGDGEWRKLFYGMRNIAAAAIASGCLRHNCY